MNRVMVAFPLYQQVPAVWFSRWLAMEKSAVTTTVTVDGVYLMTAMEIIVEKALAQKDWERLVIYEADMIPPVNAFKRVANYAPEHAVVGSMYFQHPAPHTAICYIEQPDGGYLPITPQTVKDWCADPALYRCGAVGFGFTSIARHVLENWNPNVPMFGIDGRMGSHDLWFCEKAREQGHDIYIDSGIVCEHLTQVGIGISHNQDNAHMINGADIVDFDYAER